MKNNNFFRKILKSSILVLLLIFSLFIFACDDEKGNPTNPFVDGVYEEIIELLKGEWYNDIKNKVMVKTQ